MEVRLDDWHCLDCDKDYTVEMFRDPMDVTIDAWVPGYQHCPRCGCVGLSCMEIKLTRQYERERLELEEWRRNHLLKEKPYETL